MRPRHGAYNMRPVHEGKQLASSGRAGPAQRVFGSPCPRPDSEARAPAKNHHFAAWTPPASLSIQARRGGPLEPTGTRYQASARSPRARRNTAWRRAAMRGEPGGAAKDARGWRAPAQGRARAGGSSRVASGVEEGIRRSIDPHCGHRSAMPRQPGCLAGPMPAAESDHNKTLQFKFPAILVFSCPKNMCTRLGSNPSLQQKGCSCYNFMFPLHCWGH